MESLEVVMKKNNINLDSSSHGHALFASCFSFIATYTSSDEWLNDSGASYHMDKDRDVFLL